jgi:hypothetical protein
MKFQLFFADFADIRRRNQRNPRDLHAVLPVTVNHSTNQRFNQSTIQPTQPIDYFSDP